MKEVMVRGIVSGIFILFLFGTTMAQGYAEEISATMDEVVVTGTRVPQRMRKIPANVTVIDNEAIEESNAQNLPDLIRSKEGVGVRNLLGNAKTAEVDLRGFGEAGPFNTLVLVDGRRINAPDMSGVDWAQIPLEQIERVEIVRGMGSVLYGDNAVGGVINIITKTVQKGRSFSVGGTFGSYSKHRERFSLNVGRERIGISLFGSYESTDGYRKNNEYRVEDIGGKIAFDPTDRLRLDLSGSFHSDEYGMPGALSEEEFRSDPEATNRPLDEAETSDEFLKTGFELDLADSGLLIMDFSYRMRENDSIFPTFSYASESEIDSLALTPRHVWESTLGALENTLIIGMDLYWVDQEVTSFSAGSPTGRDTIERSRSGFYLNDELSLTEDLILSVGARREKVEDRLEKRSLPSGTVDLHETVSEWETAFEAGVIYLFGEQSSLFARFNRSFRFPLTDELIETNQVTFATMINEDLKPQTGDHFEVGVKHFFSTDIQGSLTLFRVEIEDEIFYDPRPKPFVGTNENHPETLHQGIEVSAQAKMFEKITLFGNYTYEKATFEKDPFRGNDIPAVPEDKANLGVRIEDILPNLDFSMVYNYVGSSHLISDQANSLEKLDDYDTIDARLSYEYKDVKAFVGVNNITNEEYAQYGVTDGATRSFYPAPDRNWVAGLKFTF